MLSRNGASGHPGYYERSRGSVGIDSQNRVFHVGTDVGGTFTDLWVSDGAGPARVFKTPTTPDVMTGVMDAVALAAGTLGLSIGDFCVRIRRFGHGTTVGLNALLTGTSARTGVIATEGFGDTLEIGRIRRQTSGLSEYEVTDFHLHNRYPPIVPRHLVREVRERVDATGRVLIPLDEAQAGAALEELAEAGVEALAICTLWAQANPVHEARLKDMAREVLSDAFLCVSHKIAPVVGEYGRMATTAANAALGPVAGRYLSRLEQSLRDHGMTVPLLVMTNAGGVLPTSALNDRPAFTLFSGPAAGVIGSRVMADRLGRDNILTTDIGGTSFDVGVIAEGRPLASTEFSVAGADLRLPSIDIASIGTGGGSIASVEFGDLTVGPRSAGSTPGPVCYGRGGQEPTATDADLVLGILNPDDFLGGRMRLDTEAAREAIETRIARPLGLDTIRAAWGIREILDNNMADLLRRVTIERGHDPLTFTLLANGGAGPSHAWSIARELGLGGFVVPAAATAHSAFGCGTGDLGMSESTAVYVRVRHGERPSDAALGAARDALERIERVVTYHLAAAGAEGDVTLERFAAVRFRGQTNALDVPFGGAGFDATIYDTVIDGFEAAYERLFGRGAGYRQAGFEIVELRVSGTAALAAATATGHGDTPRAHGSRPVVFDDPDAPVDTTIYHVDYPAPDSEVHGPAIIEFPGQSVVVPPGAIARADAYGNLHVTLEARP
ncbi:hydantoinase/oxoprolinase family protein [Maritimibacter sp. DP07]|uniref:Hydantoinase/oxoprolinase family protein n=1 Tax=Maritimibacter harenae TaxID=2606218 RepID=A0A845M3X8_9RHOB|nr:hydantoinase/oxoprolinase family protein [Maritimibacter harenae]MZR13699.1 hydantoinase/oxoprolinase family protein [Maritimibacter harenae]